ncbi:uncharacterized protein LOC8286850 [Ricinus communis]|uniref:DUF7722 domain-containing protein n=1 Tax=Ricinus communis TaxID=3988 RepID=B9S9U6_RICCO|nr:uncharacterized protein LOC8286850 [Ricinus communis]EEF39616.1 conserved hypothetical protein [Ricinus communis]|eukprot:XP_015577028.1 uncharacterized protein LOC8286850 [Ricinus communis]
MAALKWFLSSAFTQVFGHMDTGTITTVQRNEVTACPNNQECVSNLKEARMMKKEDYPGGFQVPLHYPRYSKADYEKMEDWRLDMLLNEYGLCFKGTLDEKRAFAMGSFLWPDQL